ncbi:MAG: hypothetical protein BMS9Abin12_0281 [Acidimicrobiia bacterium]|nr:MAG: hypothetical protein BMS9Abin12_0281 [Acidimicrobiia bacterium]
MLLRFVVALGGITFIATGVGVFLTDSCNSVTWGTRGSNRAGNFTATCQDVLVDGAMSQGTAGILAIAVGLLLILTVSVPLLRSRGVDLIRR